jgi:hypothetical protein
MPHLRMLPQEIAAQATIHLSEDNDRMSAELRRLLDEFGFVIVRDVFSVSDVVYGEKLFADDLRSIVDLPPEKLENSVAGFIVADPISRWPLGEAPLGRIEPSFASDFGLPQGKFAWFVRQHPNVRRVFVQIFQSDDLCVGLDNPFFSNCKIEAVADVSRLSCQYSPHCDQSSHIQPSGSWPSFQGLLYLWGSDERSSTTVVWPGSHKSVFPDMMASRKFPHHFCELPMKWMADFAKCAGRVSVPAGAMLVWNSRLIHQGWTIGKRLAMPVCFEPVERRSKEVLAAKLQLIQEGMGSTHWASLGIPHDCGNTEPGGSEALPTRTAAHLWLLRSRESSPGQLNAVQRLL